jgi:DNA-binding beta-propeller fold protein YncE
MRLTRLTSAVFFLSFFIFHSDTFSQTNSLPITYFDSIREDEEDHQLLFPYVVFIDSFKNEIYVVNRGQVIIYTIDFFPVFTLDKSNGLETPQCLTIDFHGNVYIAQAGTKEIPRQRISVFDARLKWKQDIFFEGFEGADTFTPGGLAVDKNGTFYVAGSYFPGALILNTQGQLIEILSPEEEGEKVKLNNVTIDKEGKIYLVSEEKGHVYVYNENREFLYKFGEKGGCTGKLSRPQAVAIDDRKGMKYVVDYMRHTVLAYDAQGKYLFEFGGLGWGERWFQYPKDISVDSQGRIFVADTFNDRIQVFRTSE